MPRAAGSLPGHLDRFGRRLALSPLGQDDEKAALPEGGFFVPINPRRFGPGARALAQRHALLWTLKVLAFSSLALLAWSLPTPILPMALAKWGFLALAGFLLWHARGRWLLQPLMERELVLGELALEVRRGSFKRLVVFESLRHIQLVQGPHERVLSLRLDLDDDSVALRDLDGLEQVFSALAAAKDPKTLIEVEERRLDWAEPLPWAVTVLVAAALSAGLALLF